MMAVKAAYNAGLVLVAAAGNSGNPAGQGNNIIYPARYDEVIAVAATNQDDTRASFSSTGEQLDLSAPGVSIYSTVPGGGYASYSGTSMASPHVAGTAALVISSGIVDTNSNGRINDEVILSLINTADDLGTTGKDSKYGYGLVNAYKAVPPPLATGSIQGNVTDGQNPIAGASVTDGTRTVLTDNNGNYIINNIPDGIYTVTASKDTYKSSSQQVTVTGGATVTADFTLSIIRNGAIAGTVTDTATGLAIAGASVTDGFKTTATDSSGNYTISDVAPGTYTITASTTGYQSSSKNVNVQENTTSTANFSLSPVTQATTVSVKSLSHYTEGGKGGTAHLRIIVELADNLASSVAGATVNIDMYLNGNFYNKFSGTTSTDGKVNFKINNAPSGTYKVIVTNVIASSLIWDGIKTEYTFTK